MVYQPTRGSAALWAASSFVLADGQLGIRRNADGTFDLLTGDGVHIASGLADLNALKVTSQTLTTAQKLQARTNASAAARDEIVFNVRDYGAKGDGTTVDSTAIASAVTAAKAAGALGRGAVLFFPAGSYLITSPIVLPRTGSTPVNVVSVRGASCRSTGIVSNGTFPTNRAMIEWEASTSRTWHQEISDLTLTLPSVAGVMAIWYKKNASGTTLTDFNNERLQITLRDLVLEGNNGHHAKLIRLEGQVFYSKFERVFGDNARSALLGATAFAPITDYDTATFEFESNTYGDPVSSDILGLSYSTIDNCGAASLRRGGRGVLIRGKVKASTINNGWCDGGRYDAGIDLINSFNVHLRNCNNEGLSATQIRLKDSQHITLDKIAPSAQDPEFPEWTASTAYTTAWGVVVPGWKTNSTGTPTNANWYKCTVAGSSGASQPTWPTTVGNTVTDGTVTWQCMGPAANDAIVIDGGKHISLDRTATGPSLPNFSARGCKMLSLINSPVNVTARRCVTPDDPNTEVTWPSGAGYGDFYGSRNGERVRFGLDLYDPAANIWKVTANNYRQPRGSSGTTRTMTQNTEFCVPLDVPAGTVLDRIGINVTTSAASGVVRLGVRADASGYPGALLVDAGTIDASTTGTKELTISATTTGIRVWLCAVGQGASGIVCTGVNGPVWPVEATTLASAAGGVQAAYAQTGITGALGSFGAGNGTAGIAPLVVARTAS